MNATKKNSNEIKDRDFDIVSKMVKFACHLIFSTAQRQSASYFKWYRANNKDVGMLKYKNLKLTIYLSKLRKFLCTVLLNCLYSSIFPLRKSFHPFVNESDEKKTNVLFKPF